MGVYTEYLDQQLSFDQITVERKKQLSRISAHRGRDLLVIAADLTASSAPISIEYSDILPVSDQLANLKADKLDVIIESPGGSGEVAEDIVRLIRSRYQDVAFIVPGWAKSAATIIVLAGNDILMGPTSALGPIDAQLSYQGKTFSAHALIEGFEKIKDEVSETGSLNKSYIPILQGISPGELQSAANALGFAKDLVRDWLIRYKFGSWDTHSSTGKTVTVEEKAQRAEEIAGQLCDHGRWFTHGRSLKLDDLRTLGLKIGDYTQNQELADAIRRYHTLLQMTFMSNTYKVFETPSTQIYRFINANIQSPQGVESPEKAKTAIIQLRCRKCGHPNRVQANLDEERPLQDGCIPYPADDKLVCPECGIEHDLSETRRQLEAQSKKRVFTGAQEKNNE